MRHNTEATVQAVAIAHGEEVVGREVAKEGGNGRVKIAAPEDHEHVVDQIVDIDEVFVGGIGGAVGVESLNFEVTRISEPVGSCHPKTHPGVEGAVGIGNYVVVIGIDFNGVVVIRAAAEIGSAKIRFGTFVGVVDTPICAVDVAMEEVAV